MPDGPAPVRLLGVEFAALGPLAAQAAHGQELFGDIPNFTDVQPVAQVNEALA